MLQNKEVDTNIVIDLIKPLYLTFCCDFLFGYFIAPLDLLNEPKVVVLDVALFEDDWSYFMLRCLLTLRLFLTFLVFVATTNSSVV